MLRGNRFVSATRCFHHSCFITIRPAIGHVSTAKAMMSLLGAVLNESDELHCMTPGERRLHGPLECQETVASVFFRNPPHLCVSSPGNSGVKRAFPSLAIHFLDVW